MLSRFLHLTLRDKIALIRVVVALTVVRVGLRLLPADRLARLLGAPLVMSEASPAPPASLQTVPASCRSEMRMLDAVLRRRPARAGGSRCLEDALAIGLVLRPARPRLRIGVARDKTAVAAHAWVEAGGRSFLADPAFLPLGRPSREVE